MEIEQANEVVRKQARGQATRWGRGRSGNPRGRAYRTDRIKAECERLTREFVRLHGRAPDGFESTAIGGAALLCERLAKTPPRVVEDVVKLQNALARALKRLGMGKVLVDDAASRRSAHEILGSE
jgi:hypothetical protein